jgi:head-tail adaptor
MIAGRMKHRLVILRPVVVVDETGGEATQYKAVRTIHAERVKFSGHRSEEVAEHFPDYRTEFNIRDAHPISENWRVRQLGGYVYTVVAITPNLDKGFKTLVCERVNE